MLCVCTYIFMYKSCGLLYFMRWNLRPARIFGLGYAYTKSTRTCHVDRIYMSVISNWMCACDPHHPRKQHTPKILKKTRTVYGLFWAATDFAPYLSIDVHKNHNFPQEKLVKKCWHATIGLGSKCPKKLFPSIYSNLELMVRRDFHSFCCCWNINFVFMEVCSEFD